MENNPDSPGIVPIDKKLMNKTRSYNIGPLLKFRSEAAKRKTVNLNEAVRSLDLALGRLKKTKLANGEYATNTAPTSPVRHSDTSAELFMDVSCPSSNINPGIENASLMSMNFSHYELMRNLSHSTSNSESAFSGTTCNVYSTPADMTLKDEHLEKYFRSAELWTKRRRDVAPNAVRFQIPEK